MSWDNPQSPAIPESWLEAMGGALFQVAADVMVPPHRHRTETSVGVQLGRPRKQVFLWTEISFEYHNKNIWGLDRSLRNR